MTTFPSEPAPCQSAAAQQALQQVRSTVALAHGLAVSGRTVDLAGLDAAAGMLCAQILDLPPVAGSGFRHELAELNSKLAQLAQALTGSAQRASRR